MSIIAKSITKSIGSPATEILKGIDLEIKDSEYVSLTGRSGSGKSTLLYILSSLDMPTTGQVVIDDTDMSKISEEEIAKFRNQKMGFIFQFHYLISELSAIENIILPTKKWGTTNEHKERAAWLLNMVGLEKKHHRLPRQLSGGEQQRVAIARSLIQNPKYLFADEPTGSLDSVNGEVVMKLLEKANAESKTAIILVTHEAHFAERAPRIVQLSDGQVVVDKKTEK